ncbi:MAG: hypothetical protein FVQ78_10180 [Solirubrobacterales bacterium]|nr:hypothetical protein [Solirubrobacterales bacterium]
MNLQINIEFKQVLNLVSQLPNSQKEKLAYVIQKELKDKKYTKKPNELQKLLLQGPTWSEEEYKNFLEARAHLNQFRKK